MKALSSETEIATILPTMKRPASPQPIDEQVREVAREVHSSFQRLLDGAVNVALGPSELRRSMGVDTSQASRLLTALRCGDPVAAVSRMPKTAGLRRFVKGAKRANVQKDVVERAERAVDRLEKLVRSVGGQAALDAMLAGWIPEVRHAFELRNRQAAFRAMSGLKGVSADVILNTNLVHPGSNDDRPDSAQLMGPIAVRRLRADADVRVTSCRVLEPRPRGADPTALDGRPLDSEPCSSSLPDFCEPSSPQIRCVRQGLVLNRVLDHAAIGPQSRCTVLFGEIHRESARRFTTPKRPYTGHCYSVEIPTKLLVLDYFVHESLWPHCGPEVRTYDYSPLGAANPNDPSRAADLWRMGETVQHLGAGGRGFALAEFGRYVEALQHVCGRLGWNLEEFRGYRCRVAYPIYATQICMAFAPTMDA
jgi:hypothetical protein